MYVFDVLCFWFHLMKACSVAEHCNALGGFSSAASVALLIFSFRGLRRAQWCSDPSRPCRWDGSCHTVGRHIQTVKCHKNVRGSPVGCVAHTHFSDTPLNETKEKARPPSILKCYHRLHIGSVATSQTFVQYFIGLLILRTITSKVVYLLDNCVRTLRGKGSCRIQIFGY